MGLVILYNSLAGCLYFRDQVSWKGEEWVVPSNALSFLYTCYVEGKALTKGDFVFKGPMVRMSA